MKTTDRRQSRKIAVVRPPWSHDEPRHALDCRSYGRAPEWIATAAREAAESLSGDEVLAVTLDTEPEPVVRMLNDRGFACWTEPASDGARTVYVKREMEC